MTKPDNAIHAELEISGAIELEVTEMGWDKGKYYTRSRKVNGRVVREYVGGGQAGDFMARLDDIAKQARETRRAEMRLEREALFEADQVMKRHCDLVELLVHAALVASGFHQHQRGEWRKRHEHGDAKKG